MLMIFRNMHKGRLTGLLLILLSLAALIIPKAIKTGANDPRDQAFTRYFTGDEEAKRTLFSAGAEPCPEAPFILPASGFIGLHYGDTRRPYDADSPHQGIDIFNPAPAGTIPVYSAYEGFLTREEGWVSSVIIRVPADPLNPSDQIWLYYTHLASREGESYISDQFPAGTKEVFIPQGTVLGYMGNYNGSSLRTVATHLHFSIVKDTGTGLYSNELLFDNTLDPSPYFGMQLNYICSDAVPTCVDNPFCPVES